MSSQAGSREGKAVLADDGIRTTALPSPWSLVVLILVLFALALGCYSPVLANWFLRDDFVWLDEASRLLQDPERLYTARPVGHFRPIGSLAFALQYASFGLEPRGYYVVNVALHAWNAAWIVALSWTLFRHGPSAALAGILFVVASSWNGAVMWIANVSGLLVAAILLPTLVAHVRFLRDGRWPWYVASLIGVALCVGAKETGIVVGPMLLLLEWRERGPRSFLRWTTWLHYLPFALLAIGYASMQRRLLARSYLPDALDLIVSWPARAAASIGSMAFARLLPARREALAGVVLVVLLLVILRVCGGRSRLREGCWLVLALLAAILPFAVAGGGRGAWISRYLYEPGLFFSMLVAHAFGLAIRRLPLATGGRVARAFVLAGCIAALVAWSAFQASSTRRMITSGRYRGDAAAARMLVDSLREQSPPAGERWLLVGLPIEDDAHLRAFGAVFLGLAPGAFRLEELPITGPEQREGLVADEARVLREKYAADRVLVWIDRRGLQPFVSGDDPQGERLWDLLQRSRAGKARTARLYVYSP